MTNKEMESRVEVIIEEAQREGDRLTEMRRRRMSDGAVGPGPAASECLADAEALRMVLARARETHASGLVAQVNATTARVLEMARQDEAAVRGMQNRPAPLPPDIGCSIAGCQCARCLEIDRREAAGEPLP